MVRMSDEPEEVEPLDSWDDDGRHFRIVMREKLTLEEFRFGADKWCAVETRGVELLRRIVELKQ